MPADASRDAAAIDTLEQALAVALQAAAPARCVPPALAAADRSGAALVLGAGKAAAAMAASFAEHWDGPLRGMVVTRYGHGLRAGEDTRGVEVIEAGHPSPDAASLAAGSRLLELAGSVRDGETVWCLISGGGSSLAAQPLPGLSFEDKRDAADFLIRRGADIREVNCVRKHLSALKGGRLAARAHPAQVITLAISDVPGDNPGAIASGPTVPDASTQAEAIALLERYAYPQLARLKPILTNQLYECPKPGDPAFAHDEVHVIARAATALDAARAYLERHGFSVRYLGDDLDDEAVALGRAHAELAKRVRAERVPSAILSGGETRVVIADGAGRGGRNLEYLAGLTLGLGGAPGIYALAVDTDGLDGNADHAGAMVVPETLARGGAAGLSLAALLAASDSYRWFDACNLLLKPGPTRTNVNDFRLILCIP
jgi:glycerate 2-kinase